MPSVIAVTGVLASSVFAWTVSDAAAPVAPVVGGGSPMKQLIQRNPNGEILSMIGQFADEHTRQSLSSVNKPMRAIVNQVRDQQRYPSIKRRKTDRNQWIEGFVPCPQSKLAECLKTVGEWNTPSVSVFTENHMINVQPVPDSKKPKYNGNHRVWIKRKMRPGWIAESNGESLWVLLRDEKDGKIKRAINAKSGTEILFDRVYEQVQFTALGMPVAYSVSEDRTKHSFHLLALSEDVRSFAPIRSVHFGDAFKDSPNLSFRAVPVKGKIEQSMEIWVHIRTFEKIQGENDGYRVKLTRIDMFNQEIISESFLKDTDGITMVQVSEEDAKQNRCEVKFNVNDSIINQIENEQSNTNWLRLTNFETGERDRVMPLFGIPQSWHFNIDSSYLLIDTVYGNNHDRRGYVLYNVAQKRMIGHPLPFYQRHKFIRWLAKDIFAMEESVYGESQPSYFGVSVDKPTVRFKITEQTAKEMTPVRSTSGISIGIGSNDLSLLVWIQPEAELAHQMALARQRQAQQQQAGNPQLTAQSGNLANRRPQILPQKRNAQVMLASNDANTQPAPINNHNSNIQAGPLPMAAQFPQAQPSPGLIAMQDQLRAMRQAALQAARQVPAQQNPAVQMAVPHPQIAQQQAQQHHHHQMPVHFVQAQQPQQPAQQMPVAVPVQHHAQQQPAQVMPAQQPSQQTGVHQPQVQPAVQQQHPSLVPQQQPPRPPFAP